MRREGADWRGSLGAAGGGGGGGARCTTHWGRGIVTDMNSANNIEVDGVPRHILDVKPVVEEVPEGLTANVEEDEIRRYPGRDRCAPAWMRDYVSE